MSLITYFTNIDKLKLSLGKNDEQFQLFNRSFDVKHMGLDKFGLNVDTTKSAGNQLREVFRIILQEDGLFIFNINGVNLDLAKAGFPDFETAYDNNMITEWELFYILSNSDYLERTIFHNGKVRFEYTDIDMKHSWN